MSKLFLGLFFIPLVLVTGLLHSAYAETARYEKIKSTAATTAADRQIVIEVSSPTKLSESTISGTLIAAYSKDNKLLFSAGFPLTWNTLSGNVLGEINLFVRTPNMNAHFATLPRAEEGVHSAYLVKSGKELLLFDAANKNYYQIKKTLDGKYAIDSGSSPGSPELFKNLGYRYSSENRGPNSTVVRACKITDPKKCDEISIAPKSEVFAYGGNNSNTVAVTSKADVLFHNEHGWCRGEKRGEGYQCSPKATSFVEGRGWQVYSSMKTREGTLLGEYPTGRFWKLGPGTLEPTSLSPFSENKHNNLELQSVSLFCGDLYAGFWPHGEVWKRPLESNNWEKTDGLFSHPSLSIDGTVPYSLMLRLFGGYDHSAVLGQRATSMANYNNSLFVASGNYGGWTSDISDPWFLTKKQIGEYGLVHVKTDSNCLTTSIDDRLRLKIVLKSNSMTVFNNLKKLAQTPLHDFNVNGIDHFVMGEGVFGTLSDNKARVRIR